MSRLSRFRMLNLCNLELNNSLKFVAWILYLYFELLDSRKHPQTSLSDNLRIIFYGNFWEFFPIKTESKTLDRVHFISDKNVCSKREMVTVHIAQLYNGGEIDICLILIITVLYFQFCMPKLCTTKRLSVERRTYRSSSLLSSARSQRLAI